MERVTTIEGTEPILIIAPHGFDDKNTDVIAEFAAKELKAYAVINHGWERADAVDEIASKANCNSIKHCHEYVVHEEFFAPLLRYDKKILEDNGFMDVFIIHGCGNDVRNTTSTTLSGIVGYGDGNKPSYSCDKDLRESLVHTVNEDGLWEFWMAEAGSKFSGWGRDNLNQFWRKHQFDKEVDSMQIEFVTATRKTKADAEVTGKLLAKYIKTALVKSESWTTPTGYQFNYC